MTRYWGIRSKDGAFERARDAKPLATLAVSAAFGGIGAAVAAIGFAEASRALTNLFHGISLAAAVVAAGAGCWAYVFFAWPRFAAQFSGGDAFSDLLRFYARAAVLLVAGLLAARFADAVVGVRLGGLLLCFMGGAGAAAAFQTVLTFVPAVPPKSGA
ncbi:MAG: hypothetical protein ACFB00_08205 [Parvularculaceae bacterium]